MNTSRRALLHASAGATLLTLPLAAMAIPFQLGPVSATVDTTVSLGATFRTQNADDSLIGIANGGTSRSVNDDDGNFGFESGDIVSAVAKASHDLEFKYQNYGLFSRFTYFYDQTASDADHIEDRINGVGQVTTSRSRGDYELGRVGRDRLGSEFQMLDLFAYGNFSVLDRNLTARAGKQVINWGESTFIGNSINVVNPIDVARIRAPGAELKEALLPTPIVSLSYSLTERLSTELIWIAGWERTRIDPRSSFFSTNDFVSDDGNKAVVGFGRRNDDNRVSNPAATPASSSAFLARESSREPGNTRQQWGANARLFTDLAGGTEFGLYYLKYHNRTPLVSAVRGGATSPFGGTGTGNTAAPTCSQTAAAGCRGTFFAEFPQNIELYGLSFNTTVLGEVALQGEYSYRPNQPVQISGTEVLLTALGLPSTLNPSQTPLPVGTYVQGWRDVRVHQAQVTGTRAFGPTFGADQFVMVGEVGYNFLDQQSSLAFNGPGAGLPNCAVFNNVFTAGQRAAVSNGSCQANGYGTRHSWGYRLVNRMDFDNVIGSVQMSPRIVLAHDVTGVGPNFNQGTKAVTLGLGVNYLQRWQADLGYTTFFGGRTYAGTDPVPPGVDINPDPMVTTLSPGDTSQSASFATSANPNKDRDFLAISVSYAF